MDLKKKKKKKVTNYPRKTFIFLVSLMKEIKCHPSKTIFS